MLDGSGAAGSGEGSLSSSRRHSAALRMLRRSLVNNPKSIFETVEASMSEDFQSVRQLPGSAAVPVTARAWLELRSRVQPYATPARLLWGIAAIPRLSTQRCPRGGQGESLPTPMPSWTSYPSIVDPGSSPANWPWRMLLRWRLSTITRCHRKRSLRTRSSSIHVGWSWCCTGSTSTTN